MQLTIYNIFGEGIIKYRVYIFELVSGTVHGLCIIKPSIKIYREKINIDEDKVISTIICLKI